MEKFVIFYSWQSDVKKNTNNFFIKKSIEKAIKKIRREIDLELSLDKDTEKTSGSPNIADTIFKKISTCNLFICDVTIINKKQLSFNRIRKTPNPNVLIELGYAIKAVGWNRIICVCNTNFGKLENLPFDIRQNRIATYELKTNANISQKQICEKKLVNTLYTAIKSITDNYEQIIKEQKKDDINTYDLNKFKEIELFCPESQLNEILNFIIGNFVSYDEYYSFFYSITYFFELEKNKFINSDLNTTFEIFVKSIVEFVTYCSTHLHSLENDKFKGTYERDGNTFKNERYFLSKYPAYNETWEEFQIRRDEICESIINLGLQVKENYRDFRATVKSTLIV